MTVCEICGELAMNTLTLCQDCRRDQDEQKFNDSDIDHFDVSKEEFDNTQYGDYYRAKRT